MTKKEEERRYDNDKARTATSSSKEEGFLKSILRKQPKYSGSQPHRDVTSTTPEQTSNTVQDLVKEHVVERNPVRRLSNSILCNSKTTPATPPATPTTTMDDNQSDEPVVLSSMQDLLAHANNKIVETDLSFTCMSPDEYQEAMAEQQQQHYQVFMGKQDVFDSNHQESPLNAERNVVEEQDEQCDEEADDAAWMELHALLEEEGDPGEDVSDEVAMSSLSLQEPRAFMQLWIALSDWTTPQAIAYIDRIPNQENGPLVPQVDRSDVGASRCAGLASILKRHLHHVTKDLSTEKRLSDLLRCFDYSRPNPRLGTKLWHVLTCILVEMVEHHSQELPQCAKDVGMTQEEYIYLCTSAIPSLGQQQEPAMEMIEPGE